MALVAMKEMLRDAQQKGYAVGCYNAINLEMIRGVIEAAEQEKAPVVLCHAEVHFKYTPIDVIGPIMLEAAKRASVPVAVHLDHGKSFSAVMKALKLGFTSVMYDGSILPYEENVRKTEEVVRIAREFGVSVEAELGHVTRPVEGGSGDGHELHEDTEDLHTRPEEAARFVRDTGVDALAVAFGTAHGIYVSQPKLDFERLTLIRKACDVPLVMHGGSGLTEEDFRKAVEHGISKINYYTGMSLAVPASVKERLNTGKEPAYYHEVMGWSIETIRRDAAVTMQMFGCSNRV